MNAREDLVRTAIWAEELTPDEIDRARKGITERQFGKGAYICHRGDRLDHWTGVITGLVKVSTTSRSGKAMTFAGVGPGSWFGEGSVLKDEQRKYDLVALRETRLAMLARPTFMWLFENSTGFNRFLVRQLNERISQFIATVEYDRILHPKARIARSLAWFFNPMLYPVRRTEIAITQEELALLAGVSRPVANKSLRDLEEEGLLVVEHGLIRVIDATRLSNYEV